MNAKPKPIKTTVVKKPPPPKKSMLENSNDIIRCVVAEHSIVPILIVL